MIKQLKTIFLSLILIALAVSFFNPSTIWAAEKNIFQKYLQGLQPAINEAYGGGDEVKLQGDPFAGFIISVLNSILTFLAVIFFMLLLYAGYLWMTARGNEEQVTKAKTMIRNIIIGLLIILLSRIIIEFILGQIGKSINS